MTGEKVAIIGGGISGLCSALVLQQQGIEVEVFDQETKDSRFDTGVILGGNALKALDYFGLGKKIEKIGFPSDKCTIYTELGRSITNLTYPSPTTKFLNLHSTDLHNILIESLKPGTVHYGKTLIHFAQSEDQVKLSFSDATTLNFNYIIACDGGHSFIRSRLLPDSKLQHYGLKCWYGIVDRDEDIEILEYNETWGPRGIFGFSPLPNGKLQWYAIKKCSEFGKQEKWASMDLLFNFFSYHEPIQTILERIGNYPITQEDLFELEPLHQYLFGRILLLGDSAHMVPPTLGQGSSQAIEDALYLVKCLASETTLIEAFKQYEKERLVRTKKVLIDMNRLHKLAQLDKPALCSIRDMLLPLLPSSFHQNKVKGIFEIELFKNKGARA